MGEGGLADLRSLRYLHHLLAQREAVVATSLQASMDHDMAEGAALFEVWMQRQSDNVQLLARSYVELICLEQMIAAISKAPESIKLMLESIAVLFCLDVIETDIGVFLSACILPLELGNLVYHTAQELCRELAAQALPLVDAFGIPDHLLPPAARDWVRYNEVDNKGELIGI